MRYRVLQLAAVIVLLITWGIAINSFDVQEKVRNILGFNDADQIKPKSQTASLTTPQPKCGLSGGCPSDHFAFHISSGAADIVGPKICVDGKIIMSHVLNNVGPGLNVVVVNDCSNVCYTVLNSGENGNVEKSGFLNMEFGNAEGILAYLKDIKAGMIVLVASFDDVTPKMTNEMREVFVGMGSTLIKSVEHRDNWVLAGRAGMENRSLFEKHAANDEKTNIHEGWPETVEVGGCFPRT